MGMMSKFRTLTGSTAPVKTFEIQKCARHIIYGLTDPRTNEVRYIGKSSSGLKRPKRHGAPKELNKDKTYKASWIKQLQDLGLKYGIIVLAETDTGTSLDTLEKHWIKYARILNWPLTNLTDGGDGSAGRIVGAEERKIRSAAAKLWQSTPEARANMSARKKEYFASHPEALIAQSVKLKEHYAKHPEAKARISARQATAEARAAQSDKLKAFYVAHPEERIAAGERARKRLGTPEARAATGARMKAWFAANPEAREANAARKRSLESREAHSAWMKEYYNAPGVREAASERAKARSSTPEARAALGAQSKAYFAAPEARAKASVQAKARFTSPEARAEASVKTKAYYARRDAKKACKP